MKIVNEATVPGETIKSPKGSFQIKRTHMSLSLGGVKDEGPWAGGHPFDVELATIPPGKKNWPLHAHAAQTEYYIILSGSGVVKDAKGAQHQIRQGDHFITHPGEAHQILNNSNLDLTYYVIADHHPADITNYPETGKKMLKPGNACITAHKADYYANEE